MDDGGGSTISWKAVEYLKAMDLRPKRTIRALLFTSEEQGCIGSIQYHRMHKDNEAREFNFLLESDSGTFDPVGLDFSGNVEASCIVKEILK
jgi:carboxypeptidase Q